MERIRLVITDIDGVWTDGGMYYDNVGNEQKKFNTSDSAGVLFCQTLNIPVVIITGEDTMIVRRRAEKLKINHVYQGVKNKLKVAQKLCADLGIPISEVAFIGDDLTDVPLLRQVGFSACPANAPAYVRGFVHHCTVARGGEGAFREFVEYMLGSMHLLDEVVAKVIQQHEGNS